MLFGFFANFLNWNLFQKNLEAWITVFKKFFLGKLFKKCNSELNLFLKTLSLLSKYELD